MRRAHVVVCGQVKHEQHCVDVVRAKRRPDVALKPQLVVLCGASSRVLLVTQ